MELLPAIDLRNGKVVRLLQGDYGKQTTYKSSPLKQAQAFEKSGAKWLHVVDLNGAKDGKLTQLPQVQAICENTGLNVEVGGGVRDEAAVDQLLGVGVRRVILGTAALENWQWFEKLVCQDKYKGKIVLGLDARKGKLAVSGWKQETDASAIEIAKKVSSWPLAAIIYTDIDTDGMMKGPNLQATRQMAEATNVPVIASGGVGNLSHITELAKLPIEGTIIGKALYEGAFTIEQAIKLIEN